LSDSKSCNAFADRWRALNEFTDEELARCLLAGETDALTVLFDRYHKLVFSVAVRIVNDPAEAEEVVQTVFLDFFRGLANYDPAKGILKVWLLQYAYHRALNRRRHLAASRLYQWVELDSASQEPLLSWNPADVAEVARLMEQLMMSLTPRRRDILELTYFEGLTAEEIALKLGHSVNIVRHELYRSLAALRAVLAEEPAAVLDSAIVERGALKADA
jgi:RNA polymerase sigma-70 factor, ECF subfamily